MRRGEGRAAVGEIRKALDDLYEEEESRLDPRLEELQAASLEPEDWSQDSRKPR